MSRAYRIVALLLAVAAVARGDDLAGFLAAASAASKPAAPIRGDGELVTTSADGTTRQQIAVLQRPNGDLYLELRPIGLRALIPSSGEAMLSAAPGNAAAPFALDAPLAGSEFTREDLQPFNLARFGSPTIVDRNGAEMTVSLDPLKPSQYSLEAITFDRDKHAPVKVMLYKDTLSNLLKMRRDGDLVQLAGRWLPKTVSMENFPLRTTSTVTLSWSETADQPALFDPKTWAQPSPLSFPKQ
jgi:hypothetical protein